MKAKKDMKIKHKVTRRKLENQQNRRQRKKKQESKADAFKIFDEQTSSQAVQDKRGNSI